jgi:hypothetical protein
MMMVTLKNEDGLKRQVKVGFSWTALFFGGLPFFFRGMPAYGIFWVMLTLLTCGLSNIVLAFIINRQTATYFLECGYEPNGKGWDIAGPLWHLGAHANV